MAGRLTGHKALVTGGARGIGRAIALALAREGADVAVSYLTSAAAARTLVSKLGGMGVGAPSRFARTFGGRAKFVTSSTRPQSGSMASTSS